MSRHGGGGWRSPFVFGTNRKDDLHIDFPALIVKTFGGRDKVTTEEPVFLIDLGDGRDELVAEDFVSIVKAGKGRDSVRLEESASFVDMGRGRDELSLAELVDFADGGRGNDTLSFDFNAGDVDIKLVGDKIVLIDRFSGDEMKAKNFEKFNFADRSFTAAEIEELFGPDAEAPLIQVGGGTQTVTVNDADPGVSVLWDRTVQQAVIETGDGPTVASRAYAMMHTAMFDAWSAFDANAVTVSFDMEGDNIKPGFGTDEQKTKAMSFAAITVLRDLFPGSEELYQTVMERLDLPSTDDGSLEAQVGIDAAEDLLTLRSNDGSNQSSGYADNTGYTPVNPDPLTINDITKWTPENVPVDPEDGTPEQSFLTPQWGNVKSFGIEEDGAGETAFESIRPVAPQEFFADAFLAANPNATINFTTKEIELNDGTGPASNIAVDQSLIGSVINEDFITQAEEVVAFSANLTDEQKIIAEFWEDGGGTAFPPGTWMTFAQFVSARDNNSLDEDAQLFFAMGNAVMDAGIATWEAKVFYDYVRPVRAIRELGELGLIGEMGVDSVSAESGFVIDAWGGIDPNTGLGRGTQTILAENFVTFQLPGGNVSPPFAEYTSGHSAFSAAGAEVLQLFTGSDDFGGSVTFAPDSIIFEDNVPAVETTLEWATFTEAADEAGLSRLYGGIHFNEGDINGRTLGRDVGEDAYNLAQAFINGTATDEDRPFFGDFIV
ncbi:MAG: DUF6851 domain-containing protein [Pseudomonadota bacterium]